MEGLQDRPSNSADCAERPELSNLRLPDSLLCPATGYFALGLEERQRNLFLSLCCFLCLELMPCRKFVADLFGIGVCTVSDGCVILLVLLMSGSRAPVTVSTAARLLTSSLDALTLYMDVMSSIPNQK